MKTLTAKQKQVLTFIEREQTQTGVPPSVREIAAHFGFRSPRAASDHLDALEKKGALARTPGTARGLRVLETENRETEREPGIPIVGDVAAGLPILAQENLLGTLSMDAAFGGGELFAVRVRGDSMIDYGIFEGDFVIVRRTPVLEQDAIAVVYLEGEATVKMLRKCCEGYKLIPGNPRYEPVTVSGEDRDFTIAGPVVGVVRSMAHAR